MKIRLLFSFIIVFLFFVCSTYAQVRAYPAIIGKGQQACVDLRSVDYIVIAHQKDVSVDYYSSFNDAIGQINPLNRIFSYSFNTRIYSRVTSMLDDKFAISEVDLLQAPPTAPPGLFGYSVCDVGNDGNEIIDLSKLDFNPTVDSSICNSDDSDIVLSFYLSSDDALNKTNAISSSNYVLTSNFTIHYRLENITTNDFNSGQFGISLVSCSTNDSDGDGIVDELEDTNYNFKINDDDTDQDGILNYLDPDDDGDGISTIDEDANNNGDPTDDDVNGNGVPDYLDGPATIDMPIVNIPDANFKAALLYSNCVDTDLNGSPDADADINNDGEIQVSEALAVYHLIFNNHFQILDITGIDSFINLQKLDFAYCYFYKATYDEVGNADYEPYISNEMSFTALSQLEFLRVNNVGSEYMDTINLSGLDNLTFLDLSDVAPMDRVKYEQDPEPIAFTDINLEGCSSLQTLIYYNGFVNIDFCQIPSLIELDCTNLEGGEPEIFDFSCLVNLEVLSIGDNVLYTLILKNGSVLKELKILYDVFRYPDYICVDDLEGEIDILSPLIGPNTTVNTYCSNTPGGEFFVVEGVSTVDADIDGCDLEDPHMPNIKYQVSDGINNGIFISDVTGNYSFPLQEGEHTITPILEHPEYFNISPTSVTVDFPTDASPFAQNFCVTPIPGVNDLEVVIVPIQVARPGFDANYKIIYKNKGSGVLSGTIELAFQDEVLDFVSASPNVNAQVDGQLTWDYTNLLPFETREISFKMNLNTPLESPALNDGDVLNFIAIINPSVDDETPEDNVFTLNQTVVNSYDPNDKTCLEGNTITPDLVGEYVHYLIRCENTGSAEAVNIVIKDIIDETRFDLSTFFVTDSSHDMETRINGNVVEFIFENIYLPFDDANNDGYVAFKIKTLSTLEVGDTFENDAEIYFDYNAPIETNIAQTSIQNTLNVKNIDLRTNSFKIYPNPATQKVYIESKEHIENIATYTISGILIQKKSLIGSNKKVELSTQNFASGTYLIEVNSKNSTSYKKLIID